MNSSSTMFKAVQTNFYRTPTIDTVCACVRDDDDTDYGVRGICYWWEYYVTNNREDDVCR